MEALLILAVGFALYTAIFALNIWWIRWVQEGSIWGRAATTVAVITAVTFVIGVILGVGAELASYPAGIYS